MKKLLSFTLFMFFALSIFSQNSSIYATIDANCTSKPATINVEQGRTATGFVIGSLAAGNNCHSGARFTDRGFVIKTSSGDIVYKYHIDANGHASSPNGDIGKLSLSAGIYYVYVDGGNGASLQLKFNL